MPDGGSRITGGTHLTGEGDRTALSGPPPTDLPAPDLLRPSCLVVVSAD